MGRALLTLTVLSAVQSTATDPAPRAGEVADLIREVGGDDTLRALDADPGLWDEVLQGIASGGRRWLEVGRELRRYSGPETSELLDLALAEALGAAAEAVLEIADGTVWQVGDACGTIGFAERGASDGAYIARFIDARSRAVRAVTREDLAARRDECLDELSRTRVDLLGAHTRQSR